jgi:hypothetical protein
MSKPIILFLFSIAKSATALTFLGSCLIPHKIKPEMIPFSFSACLKPELMASITSTGDNIQFTE